MEARKKRRVSMLLALLLALLLPAQAQAAPGRIDMTRESSLKIEYLIGEKTPAPGVRFDLYRVADVSADRKYTLTGALSKYSGYVSLEATDTEEWEALATTLLGFVRQDNVTPLDTGYTNQEGRLSFSKLTAGLYLVVGGQYVKGSKTYTAVPSLVSLPDADETGTSWLYDVTMEPKNTVYDDGGGSDDTVSRKVWKKWDDAGSKSSRPAQVFVQLLDTSGKVYRTAVLNEDSNWQCIWRDLPAGVQWTVVEQPVPGYTVAVRQMGATFIVTNTSKSNDRDDPDDPDDPHPPKDPDGPGRPDNPSNPEDPGKPDDPGRTDNPDPPKTPGGPKLPQTGVLWWPVPVLLAAGLMLVIVGLVRRRTDDAE